MILRKIFKTKLGSKFKKTWRFQVQIDYGGIKSEKILVRLNETNCAIVT